MRLTWNPRRQAEKIPSLLMPANDDGDFGTTIDLSAPDTSGTVAPSGSFIGPALPEMTTPDQDQSGTSVSFTPDKTYNDIVPAVPSGGSSSGSSSSSGSGSSVDVGKLVTSGITALATATPGIVSAVKGGGGTSGGATPKKPISAPGIGATLQNLSTPAKVGLVFAALGVGYVATR